MICQKEGFKCKCKREKKCVPKPFDINSAKGIKVFKQEEWDLDPSGPTFIRSKKHLIEECNKRDLIPTGYA